MHVPDFFSGTLELIDGILHHLGSVTLRKWGREGEGREGEGREESIVTEIAGYIIQSLEGYKST